MNVDQFRARLALEPVVRSALDLPEELRQALRADSGLRAVVDERIRIDRALDAVPTLESTDVAIERILRAVASDSKPPARLLQRRNWIAAAAILLLGVGAARVAFERMSTSAPVAADDELLARMDLLMDWDVLNAHADDLDLLAVAELASAVADLDGDVIETETPK